MNVAMESQAIQFNFPSHCVVGYSLFLFQWRPSSAHLNYITSFRLPSPQFVIHPHVQIRCDQNELADI